MPCARTVSAPWPSAASTISASLSRSTICWRYCAATLRVGSRLTHQAILWEICVVKVRDVIAAVEQAGWVYARTAGSHRQYVRPGQPGVVTVPGKLGDEVPEGTLTGICRQAGIDKA